MAVSLIDLIKPGDKVTILRPGGRNRDGSRDYTRVTGRATMRGPAGWVLNCDGPHGTPAIADEENIVSVPRLKYGHQ
jgi:hypothetical protein